MKILMLTASAFTLIAAPAHAQLLGGGGLSGVTGSINGTVNSTLRAPTETLRSTTRGTFRGDASTRGKKNVDRENGNVSIDRSLDTNLDATTSQLIGTPAGEASGSTNASGSGGANAQLLGTNHVNGAVNGVAGKARETASTVRNFATPAVGSARDRISGAAGQAGSVGGSGTGAGTGSGMIDNGILALAGSGAAQGEGAFSVAPGMPVHLPSGQQIGNVRDIVATRSGEIRQVVIEKKDGLTTIPASQLTASGTALIAGEGTASASKNAPAEASDAD